MGQCFIENLEEDTIILDGDEAHHLIHVTRAEAGEQVTLFDGQGTSAIATILAISKRTVELHIQSRRHEQSRTNGRVIIAASVAKGDRFDWLLTKCIELGIDHIVPVIFERTVKLAVGTNTQGRYKNLAIAACKQCGRTFLPVIDAPVSLNDAISRLKQKYTDARLVFGSTAPDSPSIQKFTQTGIDYIAFIGPEGGMTTGEEDMLLKNGATAVRLTSTTLRIETAAVAFAAILCTLRDSERR